MYIIKDSYGYRVGKIFKSYKDAMTYKIANSRLDWTIEKLY